MVVTAKQLRLKTSQILKRVQRVGSLTVTLRGKPVARLSSLNGKDRSNPEIDPAVGMWAGREDLREVGAWVRKVRKPRFLP